MANGFPASHQSPQPELCPYLFDRLRVCTPIDGLTLPSRSPMCSLCSRSWPSRSAPESPCTWFSHKACLTDCFTMTSQLLVRRRAPALTTYENCDRRITCSMRHPQSAYFKSQRYAELFSPPGLKWPLITIDLYSCSTKRIVSRATCAVRCHSKALSSGEMSTSVHTRQLPQLNVASSPFQKSYTYSSRGSIHNLCMSV